MKQRALAPLLVVVMVLGTLHLTAYSTPTLDITSDQLASETPVYIDGDTNFTATASARGWSGTGASDDPIMIDGIEIQGSGVETLVSIQNTALYFIIENSSFNNSQLAIYVNFSPNGIIRQNTITHAGDGMIIASSQNTTVSRNDISLVNNRGIYFDRSDDGSITDNIIDGGIEGITLNRADNNTVASNTVSNAWDYGIVSSLSSYNNISHNEVFDNRYGIFLTDPFRTLIDSNTAHHNELGIYGTDSRSNLFSNNIVYENIDGLHVDRQDLTLTERSNITGTLAYDNIESGIKVSFGEGMHIRDNEMYGNGRGFETFFGLEHHVFDNNIHDNDVGMYLDSPENHNITGHNLINNGFHLAYYLDNLIYHKLNSLGDNTVNGLPVYYLNHSTGVSITGDFGQILLVNVSNSDIGGVTINNSSAAVFLADSANTTISQSNFTGNHAGVGVYRSDGTSIKDVRVTNGTYGIEIVESSDVKVNSSDLFANKNGLVADMADDLVLFENNIHHNREDGVRIQQSSNIVVTGNIIAYNGYLSPYPVNTYGIQLNSFIETDLKDSGMYVIFGLNNLISKNSFLYNQGFGVHSEGLATVEENDFVENSNHPNATRLPCEFECGEIFGNDGNFGNNFFSTYQG
ncbi:MAG: right-handed parallel beta-helix repeat-containing protein, partial [Candidatus Kariarchaeaceae archaeon]